MKGEITYAMDTELCCNGLSSLSLAAQSGVENAGFDEEVLHTIQILAESYRVGKEELKRSR
jgi:glycolate oxidase iron-sulfur subunit